MQPTSKEHKRELHRKRIARYRKAHPEREKERLIRESRNKNGYLWMIYRNLKRMAYKWHQPICKYEEFKRWSLSGVFVDLFVLWKHSNFNEMEKPVIERGMKKLGFVLTNIRWEIARNLGYYDKTYLIREELMEQERAVRNKRTPEWRIKVRAQWADRLARKMLESNAK
jgi:hypothetical protein